MLPKVQDAAQVQALDMLLTQLEKANGLEVGRIGIEAQIETAQGLINVNQIAFASPRIETIIFGPADFMASINMKSLVVGALHRSEEHTSELQSRQYLVCRLLLEKKKRHILLIS